MRLSGLTIDKEAFDTLPAFTRYGGWGRASKAGPQFSMFIKQLNQAIAA
jgi:hypothetical protein